MTYEVGHYINGEIVKAGKQGAITNSATGEVIGQVYFADEKIANNAVLAAKQAYPQWAAASPLRRARVFFRFKELLETNIDELAAIVIREHGKVLSDAKGSILRGIELIEFACGTPNLLKGNYSQNVSTDMDCYTIRQAIGVCVGVSPFNFPVMVPIWQFAFAIACGNTFILKPSEQDPSSVLYLADLLTQAGLPPGVLNVVNGDKVAVDHLIKHPDVVAATAVASTPVAETIYQTAILHGKRSHTFGGAKNHCVIMPDVDMEQAANAVIGAAYGSAGERCMAVSVIVAVGDETGDALLKQFKQKIPELKIGPGTEAVDMGPLISKKHWERVKSYIDLGVKEGGELVFDGRNYQCPGYEKGFFMGPSLFDNVTSSMRIYREEIFGPVLCMVRVPDFSSAIDLVNQHEYGNGVAIFTRDGDLARTFAHHVEVGMVGVNVPIPVPIAYHAFGGWKHSLFGDVHLHADQSIQFYTKLKSVTTRWPKGKYDNAEFAMPVLE